MRLRLDDDGPGSYNEILAYIETVIRENCEMRPDRMVTAISEDKEARLARVMLASILSRMDVEPGLRKERV